MDVVINGATGANSATFLSRILQIALGLFVTTSDLPRYSSNGNGTMSPGYSCTFDVPCGWFSEGTTGDRWRLARGEPDPFLWLASTGTMQRPAEPFALIELRGQQADRLLSDEIVCQDGTATLSFAYWIVGGADLEVCLVDLLGKKFNCTAMLGSRPMPGKVLLAIPQVEDSFRIAIIPNIATGIIAIDDIKYDATPCQREISSTTLQTITETETDSSSIEMTTESWATKSAVTEDITTPLLTESTLSSEIQSTELPFDLLIIGNKTTPLFDHRRGRIIDNNTMLLCDFTNDFPCLWGPESGRWGIIQEGAVPSLTLPQGYPTPSYPAAIVLQGTAMLTSDPVKCQTGPGKLMFRHWTNGSPVMQGCVIGYGVGSKKVECVDASQDDEVTDDKSLVVFNFPEPILEPFTLNIIPRWGNAARNNYLIIDEIAYVGSCDPKKLNKEMHEKSLTEQNGNILRTKPKSYGNFVWPVEQRKNEQAKTKADVVAPKGTANAGTYQPEWITLLPTTSPGSPQPNIYASFSDYCELLNCNFEENACNYLNHGLTKVPWMLRNRGYGERLSESSDIPLSPANGQFISTILSPGQYAILESPRFKAASETNTLLFQYYRSSFYSTIRLCLGSYRTQLYRKASDFAQCPSVLGPQLTKSVHKWGTARVRLPPGTTHFYLVAHNSNKSTIDTAIAIDNIRLTSCNPENDAVVDTDNTVY